MKTSLTTKLKSKAGIADAGLVINRAAETAKDRNTLTVADGTYNLISPVRVFNKGLRIECSENVLFRVYHPEAAFTFDRNQSTSDTHLINLRIQNGINENNSNRQHGVVSHVPTVITGMEVNSMWGDGIRFIADVNGRPGTQARTFMQNSVFGGNRGNGIFLQGGDANAGTFIHVDVRDNRKHGIHDASMLGNAFISCMGHNNYMGNYFITDVNNRSTLTGCYSEGDSPYDYIYGQCQVFGGFFARGVVLSRNAVMYSYNTEGQPTIFRAPYSMDKHRVNKDGTVVTMRIDGTFPKWEEVDKWTWLGL